MVISARHQWSEPKGFIIHRPTGLDNYTFLHFMNPVQLLVDGQIVPTHPNACILYGPDTPQWFLSETPLVHDWMHLDPSVKAMLDRYEVPVDRLMYPADCTFLTSGICEIELEIYSSRVHRFALADAAAEMLLIRYARACSSPLSKAVNPELSAQLLRFRNELFAHLGENWTTQRMADAMHMSCSRFFAVYKAQFDISPMNDLIQARIDAAKSALIGSDLSISGLAERLGYANVTHFSRQFRQKTGVSPRDYGKK